MKTPSQEQPVYHLAHLVTADRVRLPTGELTSSTPWPSGIIFTDTSFSDTALPFELTIGSNRFVNNESNYAGVAIALRETDLQT